MKKTLAMALALAAALLLPACTVGRSDAAAPSSASPAANESRPRRDGAARMLYETYCQSCHGDGLAGGRAPSVFRTALLAERTDPMLLAAIRQGNLQAGMPAFDQILQQNQIEQLITFLRNEAASLAERPPFVASPDGQVVRSQHQDLRVEVVASGLDVPWGLAFLPDGRLLFTERTGRLHLFDVRTRKDLVVSGLPTVHTGQDAGLFDVAVHPAYAKTGWVYLAYAESLPGAPAPAASAVAGDRPARAPSMTVIVRGRLNERAEWVDMQEIFRAPAHLHSTSGVHYGTRMVFDKAGRLYYSLGERGDMAAAQDLSSPLGKIHRVEDDGKVPADNPFAGKAGALASIWSYGHRNPQGLAFDPSTGLLWESEHGPQGGDEINVIEPGRNYGWGVVSKGLERGIEAQSAPGMQDPIVHYTPTLAPSGIAFYDGDRYPAWKGQLFVAGLAGQQLRRLETRGREILAQEVVFDRFGRTRAVATGPDGLLYVLLQSPTGSGTGLRLSDPSPGMLVRLHPMPKP